MLFPNILLLTSAVSAAVIFPKRNNSTELPTIDLGYGVYRATYYNSTGDSYTFSNIRFAAPPIGNLRFGPPQLPLQDRSKVHDGSVGFICPQAEPLYLIDGRATDPASEDCLFLDVIVPRKVLSGEYGAVPVLFWIYGGGYGLGSKTQMGDPLNFLIDSPSPVIWVAPNYRLGVFGWLGGPTFTLSNGTVPNAGLYDQRFALEWTQNYIHIFHGNKDEVTIMGASAGAGSIMHHITAYGGQGKALFKRAVPFGPGFFPEGGHASAELGYTTLEDATGCTGKGVECLRTIDTTTLQKINEDLIKVVKAPSIGYGPIVDGNYVPDMPSYLLAQGRFHKNISLLVADDINEGYYFTPQNSTDTGAAAISDIYSNLSNATINSILAFYPPPSNSTPYTNETGRLTKLIADMGFNCNRYSLSAALPSRTYNLLTTIPPGLHGTGVTLIFQNVPGQEQVITSGIQGGMRRFTMNFVVTGNPNEADGSGVSGGGGVVWPTFGEGKGLEVSGQDMKVVSAVVDKAFCEWWAKGLILS